MIIDHGDGFTTRPTELRSKDIDGKGLVDLFYGSSIIFRCLDLEAVPAAIKMFGDRMSAS